MKAVYSQDTIDYLMLIRQSLGGAGYSAWSRIPCIIEDYAPSTTFEGDNTVMLQQSFNFLLKEVLRAKSGQPVVFPYIQQMD